MRQVPLGIRLRQPGTLTQSWLVVTAANNNPPPTGYSKFRVRGPLTWVGG